MANDAPSLRDELARILETVAKDGLNGPRDLDVALDAIMETIKADPVKVYVGYVRHEEGTNTYADTSIEGVKKQIADFCREWWGLELDEEVTPTPVSDDDVIRVYFEAVDREECGWNREPAEIARLG